MKLADLFTGLLAEHDLTSVSISIHQFAERVSYTAYAHWENNSGRCGSGDDETPEMAIAKAIAQANAYRGRGVGPIEAIEVDMAA